MPGARWIGLYFSFQFIWSSQIQTKTSLFYAHLAFESSLQCRCGNILGRKARHLPIDMQSISVFFFFWKGSPWFNIKNITSADGWAEVVLDASVIREKVSNCADKTETEQEAQNATKEVQVRAEVVGKNKKESATRYTQPTLHKDGITLDPSSRVWREPTWLRDYVRSWRQLRECSWLGNINSIIIFILQFCKQLFLFLTIILAFCSLWKL